MAGRLQILAGDGMSRGNPYSKVPPSFWITSASWDDTTRLAGVYILTGAHRWTEGIYRLPVLYAANDLVWPATKFTRALANLRSVGFVEYDERNELVLIVDALRLYGPNANQLKSAAAKLSQLPPSHLVTRFMALAREFSPPLYEHLRENLPQALLKGSESLTEALFNGNGKGSERLLHSPVPTPTPHSNASSGGEQA